MSPTVKLFEMPGNRLAIKRPEEAFAAKKAVPVMTSVSFDKVTQSIIANQLALNCNESLKYTQYYKKRTESGHQQNHPVANKSREPGI